MQSGVISCMYVCRAIRMQPHQQQHQQTVITQPAVVPLPFISPPHIVTSFRHTHANIISISLIFSGAVNVIFSIIEIVCRLYYNNDYHYYTNRDSYTDSYTGVSGYGVVCGAMVSNDLHRKYV